MENLDFDDDMLVSHQHGEDDHVNGGDTPPEAHIDPSLSTHHSAPSNSRHHHPLTATAAVAAAAAAAAAENLQHALAQQQRQHRASGTFAAPNGHHHLSTAKADAGVVPTVTSSPMNVVADLGGTFSGTRQLPSRDVGELHFQEAYIQFIMYCNPHIPLDTDTADLRRAFKSVPRSDGKQFETYTLFKLISKFEHGEIKTWTKLSQDLGVVRTDDQSPQKVQQYAVRLKRWIRSLHLDAFFDFLLGKANSYYTNPAANDPSSAQYAPSEDDEDLVAKYLSAEGKPKRGRRKGMVIDSVGRKRPRIDQDSSTSSTSAASILDGAAFGVNTALNGDVHTVETAGKRRSSLSNRKYGDEHDDFLIADTEESTSSLHMFPRKRLANQSTGDPRKFASPLQFALGSAEAKFRAGLATAGLSNDRMELVCQALDSEGGLPDCGDITSGLVVHRINADGSTTRMPDDLDLDEDDEDSDGYSAGVGVQLEWKMARPHNGIKGTFTKTVKWDQVHIGNGREPGQSLATAAVVAAAEAAAAAIGSVANGVKDDEEVTVKTGDAQARIRQLEARLRQADRQLDRIRRGVVSALMW